jgi:mRNA deadenylase 3'-5' endonuclease subunit Ccr4
VACGCGCAVLFAACAEEEGIFGGLQSHNYVGISTIRISSLRAHPHYTHPHIYVCTMKVTNGVDRFGRPYVEKKSAESLIRLQNYVDEDIIPSDRAQLWSKIIETRHILEKHNVDGNNVELYSRSWEPSSQQQQQNGNVDDRAADSNVGDSSSCFTVAQFNTLARGLSSGPNDLFATPFETDSELHDGSYGGFTELTNPEVILDFDRLRKWRLLEVILGGSDACTNYSPAFDIVALEEVDEYHSFFEPILVKDGCYCGIYQPKPYSPCVRFGWYSDGVALLWKEEKFKVIDECSIDPNGNNKSCVVKGSFEGGANQVYIIVQLQIQGTEKCIVVAATHLKAKKGTTNEQIRLSQATEIRHRAEQMADQLKELGWKVNILILGDFNSEPDSQSVRSILCEKSDWKFNRSTTVDDNDDSYTTWKTRKNCTTRRVIDYIFHTSEDGFQCKEVLSIPRDEELERAYLPGFRYPSDHLLVAAKFHFHLPDDRAPETSSSPFEWLTNFQSLRHLVLPSYIIGSTSHMCSVKLNALHVGCGTSTVGESLLCLLERDEHGNQLQYGHVVNVDVDRDALEHMQHRWRQRELQTQQLDNITLGVMDWRYLDFKSEESCRLALDPLYHTLMQPIPCNSNNDVGGYFDLVLDKSTLDCLLCSETDVVSVFLCEVYRALRIPTLESEPSLDVDNKHTSGGVYVLVTFHPLEFIQQLLEELPGAHWDIEYEVIKRKADIVNTIDALEVDEVVSGTNESECVPEAHLPPVSSAWISGSFCPDENYRKTITVFTCRRRLNPNQEETKQTYTLDRHLVREHIEATCDKWYQTTSPMVTSEREAKLRQDFQNAYLSQQQADSAVAEEVVLDLKTCYEIIFTEEEKQVLPYDYFIEDWEAYCQNNLCRGDDFRDGMTIKTAIDFLKEMQ